MRSRKVINWPAHPSFPLLVEITLESDWDGRVFAAGDVVKANVCAELVDDPAVPERRVGYVPARMPRELLERAAVRIHRPKVHGAVAVRREVDPALPPHWGFARTRVAGG